MTDHTPSLDNRRATARVMTYEVLRGLAAMARHARWDMIQFLVFSGVWSANTQHLLGPKTRYGELNDIPPTASVGRSRRPPWPTCSACPTTSLPDMSRP